MIERQVQYCLKSVKSDTLIDQSVISYNGDVNKKENEGKGGIDQDIYMIVDMNREKRKSTNRYIPFKLRIVIRNKGWFGGKGPFHPSPHPRRSSI